MLLQGIPLDGWLMSLPSPLLASLAGNAETSTVLLAWVLIAMVHLPWCSKAVTKVFAAMPVPILLVEEHSFFVEDSD